MNTPVEWESAAARLETAVARFGLGPEAFQIALRLLGIELGTTRAQLDATDALTGSIALASRGLAVLAGTALRLHPSVLAYVLGVAEEGVVRGEPVSLTERVRSAVEGHACEKGEGLLVLRGHRGSGRGRALRRWLRARDVEGVLRSARELRESNVELEPRLSGRIPVWDGRGALQPGDLEAAARFLAHGSSAVALLDVGCPVPWLAGRPVSILDLDPVNPAERDEVWSIALGEGDPRVRAMATRVRVGVDLACSMGTRDAEPADLHWELAREVLGSAHGVIVERPVRAAVPLLEERTSVAVELVANVMERHDGAGGRPGAHFLFEGPPGTGKTMTARYLASRLERPLARVDLASLVSKWVGETEKNLRDVLERAQIAGAILLFDDGEVLFAKRGEVQRGSDRYANLEVSYLLQALEQHDGCVIVTTNLPGLVDEAFLRRFDVVVEFPAPDRDQRARLWQHELGELLPEEWLAALSAEELTGGHIAAAARIARLTADAAAPSRELAHAVELELRKLGRSVEAARWHARGRECG